MSIAIRALADENYESWRLAYLNALPSKNKWDTLCYKKEKELDILHFRNIINNQRRIKNELGISILSIWNLKSLIGFVTLKSQSVISCEIG